MFSTFSYHSQEKEGDHVSHNRSGTQHSNDFLTFTRLLDCSRYLQQGTVASLDLHRPWYQSHGQQISSRGNQLSNLNLAYTNSLASFSKPSTTPSGGLYRSGTFHALDITSPTQALDIPLANFGYNIPAAYCNLDIPSLNTRPIPHTSIYRSRSEQFERLSDKDYNLTSDMALTSGKKLCKLDAICAKLKKISNTRNPENETIANGTDKSTDEVATDLSAKCLNNNIIGKLDLHTVDDTNESQDGLDLTKNKEDNEADVTVFKNSEISKSEQALTKQDANDKDLNKESNNEHDKETSEFCTPAPKVTDTVKTAGSSRRKSRKASAPRSISQVRDIYEPVDDKDELAEYEINNLNTNFPPDETEEGESDLSSSKKHSLSTSHECDEDSNSSLLHSDKSLNNSNNSRKSLNSLNSSEYASPSGVLDLSVNNKSCSKQDQVHNGYNSSDADEEDDDYFHRKRKLIIDEQKGLPRSSSSSLNLSHGSNKDSNGEQAAHLKDFAENTMNELISMYGYGGAGYPGTDLSKHIPMKNFSDIIQQAQAAQLASLAAIHPGLTAAATHPISIGDEESRDRSQPMKNIYANMAKSGQPVPSKVEGVPKLPKNDRFTSSSSFINAMYSSPGSTSQPGKTLLPNYSKYLKRYNTGMECGGQHCKDLSYKEHYHCIDCSFQVFVKKEEMVRHYKWHRKREESLQHGFLRFSPLDDCTKRFGPCTHNGKQTHYHCLQNGCDKVYISTSDVQMHANYHRKDSAIMSEGFQRFRATEDCGTLSCAFYGQRTTHFHCLRSDCKFTFKNKADMEKHKSYHQKDEVLGRDGFKKFMKYEHCNYSGCRYSKVSNHIHCIRSGCDYVLHSTAQLYSHKRKHERRDFESAYKRFRDNHPPGSSQSQKHGQVPILPRPDMSRLQFQPINGSKTGLPTLGSLSGLKRASDIELSEPFELKKPKLEPMSDIDMSAPSSPGGQSDDHSSTMDRARSDFDQMDTEASNMSECSSDMLQDENRSFDKINTDQDGVDLNSSLNLPIHPLQVKSEFKMEAGGLSTSSSPTLQPSIMPGTLTGNLITLNPGTLMTVPSTLTGASTVLQPPKSVYAERREKDDSWKTYLVRYTANDPCNPRCQYLYKDHYHCKVDGCLVLFKSKDGVREHARFHELQDRITPIAYSAYEVSDTCPEACQYSEKEKHFHCIWTGCTHVVPYVGPTFGRLEHYRIHEYARAAAGKSYSKTSKNSLDENSMRRRGRPPKYPKLELPKIPKVELTDEEIRQSHVPDSEVTSKLKVINGFRIFTPDDPCPDEQCNFVGKVHFHCARPRCFTITDRQDVLNLHAQDFHSFVKILEGFEFFDRNVSCRRLHCPNNQNNRHFHCTRPKCDYSFIRHSTMAQHEKKHLYSETGGYPGGAFSMKNDVPVSPTAFRRDVPIKNLSDTAVSMESNLGQASPILGGEKTYIPVSNMKQLPHIPLLLSSSSQLAAVPQGSIIFPQQGNFTLPQASLATTSLSGSQVSLALTVSSVQALPASVTSQQVLAGLSPQLVPTVASGAANSPTEPLTVLLQRGVNPIPQPSWNELKAKMHYTVTQNCGRPFCKLKKKDHFHCYDCNQAFSDPARLRSHMGKHGIKLKRTDPVEQTEKASPPTLPTALETKLAVEGIETDMDPDEAKCLEEGKEFAEDSEAEDELKSSSSLNLNPSTFSEMITKAQEQNKISPEMDEDEEEDCNRDQDEDDLDGNQSDASEPKLDLSSRSGRKITKTKHEDFMNSGEINLSKQQRKPKVNTSGQSSNGLSPKGQTLPLALPSRNLKDDLVPDGYSKWKYNEECNYPKCAYRHSVTHFHCNREDCGYGFSDRSRLVQHTLRHERIDSITGGELQQYRINQDCENAECEFNKKMSHFHCKRCIYSCTDSSKVLTHRKYHAKLDNIANQGFQKYSTIEDCGNTLCPYARKQTHFHCLKDACNIAVLGPAQMTSHKAKHM